MKEAIVTIQEIPLHLIDNRSNIRLSNGHDKESLQELANSIRENGLIQPIVLRATEPDDESPLPYMIVAGRRRLAAHLLLDQDLRRTYKGDPDIPPTAFTGLTIPAIVSNATASKAYELEMAENIHRQDMTLMDTAIAVRTLLAIHDKGATVAKILGKSTAWVSKHLAITSNAFDSRIKALAENEATQDIELLGTLNQIAKQPGAEHLATRLINAAAIGQCTRAGARAALDHLKHGGAKTTVHADSTPPVTDPEAVALAAAMNSGSRMTITIPYVYHDRFERMGGVTWLMKYLDDNAAQAKE